MFEVKIKKIVLPLFTFLMFICAAIVLAIFLSIKAKGNEWLIFSFITAVFLTAYIIGVVDYFRYKIIVSNKCITLIKTFGKTREYSFEDIRYYQDFKIYKERIIVYFNDGKSVCVDRFFYNNFDNFAQRIRQTGKAKNLL